MATKKRVLKIIQGEDRLAKITLRDEESGDPIDLSTVSEIQAKFIKDDGTGCLTKTLTGAGVAIVDATLGKITVTLDETDTAALLVKDNQDFEIEVQDGTETRIVQFIEQLTVKARLC